MSCPVTGNKRKGPDDGGADNNERQKLPKIDEGLYYPQYLALDVVLNAQHPESAKHGPPAHEEHLFIITHQVYELWFKQILHELDSVMGLFAAEFLHHHKLSLAVNRLGRIIEIQRVLVAQIDVLETMTPGQFLEFRDVLHPASGFQSAQFRKVEIKLGLEASRRLRYTNAEYCSYLRDDDARELKDLEGKPSLFTLVERWLERTPGVWDSDFDFTTKYQSAVREMFAKELAFIRDGAGPDDQKAKEVEKCTSRLQHFESVFDKDKYDARLIKKEVRLSQRAMQAALMITLYQDEPLLHYPFQLLQKLQQIDEFMTAWRYRHSQMVHRMLGDKIGTGGSSGYRYLQGATSAHKIFTDLNNISTFLIPRHLMPPLTPGLKRLMSFTFEKDGGRDQQ